jgi:hypothetical protein
MALTNVREFTVGLDAFVEEADERRRQIAKAVGIRALSGVVLGTRVDTGRARGNWQVQEGAPPEGHDPLAFHPTGGGLPGGRSKDSVAEGTQVVLQASGDDVIWLHNGVPYIHILEDLDKMVEVTVELLKTWIGTQAGYEWRWGER